MYGTRCPRAQKLRVHNGRPERMEKTDRDLPFALRLGIKNALFPEKKGIYSMRGRTYFE